MYHQKKRHMKPMWIWKRMFCYCATFHFDSKCTSFLTMTVLWFLFGKLSLISSQRTLSIITLTTYPLNGFWKILPCSLSSWNFYFRLQFLKINKVFEDYQLFKEQYTKRLDRLLLLNSFMYLPVKCKKSKSKMIFKQRSFEPSWNK